LIPSDRKLQATQLVEQAERLLRLARQLRREAKQLDPTVEIPTRRKRSRGPRAERSPDAEQRVSEQSPSPTGRRFVPAAEISEGARLMITQMANLGASREEILTIMRDELDLHNAEAVLETLQLWSGDAGAAGR
jgi:hypothetical protein